MGGFAGELSFAEFLTGRFRLGIHGTATDVAENYAKETTMTFKLHTLRCAVPLVGALFLAAACSSSSDPVVEVDLLTPNPVQTFFDTPSDAESARIAARSAAAAENGPVERRADPGSPGSAGSIVQSSSSDSIVSVSRLPGTPDYTFSVSGALPFVVSSNPTALSSNINPESLRQIPSEPDEVFLEAVRTERDVAHNLYVYLRTDTPNGLGEEDDDNYLAYGFWIADPQADGAAETETVIGAFVDSSRGGPFTQDNLAGLTGSATYNGKAHGLYHELVSDAPGFATFEADSTLTAEFGEDNTTLGTITGSVSTFTFSGLENNPYPADLSIDLPSATITVPNATGEGGFYTAATDQTLTVGGTDTAFTGNWGGQFYDDGAAAADHPGTVAGTFGLADADGIRSFLGIFWADLDTTQ